MCALAMQKLLCKGVDWMHLVFIILGIIIFGLIMTIIGVAAINMYDNEILRKQHPPDPRHRQWPQDGDDP